MKNAGATRDRPNPSLRGKSFSMGSNSGQIVITHHDPAKGWISEWRHFARAPRLHIAASSSSRPGGTARLLLTFIKPWLVQEGVLP